MNTDGIPAIVLAGGPSKPAALARGWPPYRALAELCGKPVLSYVLDALRASESVGEIAVVGPEDVRNVIGDATLLPIGDTMWDNVSTGLRHAPDGPALLCGADVPLLTPAAVDDVATRGLALNADFVYPIIRRDVNEARCPGLKRTYATVREGTFTGGNLMLVNAPRLLASDAVIRRALAARKNPLALARMISPALVLKVLCKRASIGDLERAITRILNARAAALITSFAEIGADIDAPEETAAMEALMQPARPTDR
jgi:CTP:molybdopterin cytidylyltransferase MocA